MMAIGFLGPAKEVAIKYDVYEGYVSWSTIELLKRKFKRKTERRGIRN